ncbi:hypothetical protein C7413_15114 [Paraburkholderia silvatlantica]|nr:hypothetical protein C7413_15114 [Paraburkholderia silvatlantica]
MWHKLQNPGSQTDDAHRRGERVFQSFEFNLRIKARDEVCRHPIQIERWLVHCCAFDRYASSEAFKNYHRAGT